MSVISPPQTTIPTLSLATIAALTIGVDVFIPSIIIADSMASNTDSDVPAES
jgi:hypothetical protein